MSDILKKNCTPGLQANSSAFIHYQLFIEYFIKALPLIMMIMILIPVTASGQQDKFQYASPHPGSVLVSPQTNIILRYGPDIDRRTLTQDVIIVEGSASGVHSGEILLSDDNKTIVFNPYNSFRANETVNVSFLHGVKTTGGYDVPGYSFSFSTLHAGALQNRSGLWNEESTGLNAGRTATDLHKNTAAGFLPAPPITVDSVNNPSAGTIFLATWDRNVPQPKYANFIFMLDSAGRILDSLRINGPASDFKILPNGLLSYSVGSFSGIVPSGDGWKYYVADNKLTVLDSFQMKNGYSTDGHEFLLLPNGHALLMSYYTVTYDMTTLVKGGYPDAVFTICILQEQDADKNVVFEWRDIDHIPITETDALLTSAQINYTTLNAFIPDVDGNFLVSSRNLSSVFKISRSTGEILWRLGGKRNEFKFIGEHAENSPYYFARQHHITRLNNGHITLFDNGDFHNPSYSRAVEYSLDEVSKTAIMVSEYRYPKSNIFSLNGGAAHKLPGGGWFLGFGNLAPQSPVKRIIVEAHSDGSTALEISVPNNVTTYRIAKQLWNKQVFIPSVTIPEVYQRNTYSFNKGVNNTGVSIKYVQIGGTLYNMVTVSRIPYGPVRPEFTEPVPMVYPVSILYDGASVYSQSAEVHIDLSLYPEIKNPAQACLYIRETAGKGAFTKVSALYNPVLNELTANITCFGEIVFADAGATGGTFPPVPFFPENNQKVLHGNQVRIKWTGKGVYSSFQLQVSSDSMFNSVVLNEEVKTSSAALSNPLNHQVYYWRLRAVMNRDTSAWSQVQRFETADAFIRVTSPNGKETWAPGSQAVIRWDTDISDSLRLYLFRGAQSILSIGSASGTSKGFLWNIPPDLNSDSTYSIKAVSSANNSIMDFSDAFFNLKKFTGIENEGPGKPGEYRLMQNYPNPFNAATRICYQLPEPGNVKISVYDFLGREIATLVNEYRQAGSYYTDFNGQDLASGIYIYHMKAGGFTKTKVLVLVK